MSGQKKVFRYIYDENNQLHVDNVNNNVWPPPDEYTDPVSGVTTIGWWVGIGELSAQTVTSPDFPDQNYNEPELQAGEVQAGLEPVPVKFGDSFENNYNPAHGKGVYLAGVIGFTAVHRGYNADDQGALIDQFDIEGGVELRFKNLQDQQITHSSALHGIHEGATLYVKLTDIFFENYPNKDVLGMWWSSIEKIGTEPAEIYDIAYMFEETMSENTYATIMPDEDIVVWIVIAPEGTDIPSDPGDKTLTIEVYDNADPTTIIHSTTMVAQPGTSVTINANAYIDPPPDEDYVFDRWEGWHTGTEEEFTQDFPEEDSTLRLYYDVVLT